MGLALGYLASSIVSSRQVASERELRVRQQTDADREMQHASREMLELRARVKDQGEVFQILPELVNKMFLGSKREAVGYALKLVDRLFDPQRAAIFVAAPAARRLRLVEGRGLPASLQKGHEVEYGDGPIGYVAENMIAMDEADFGSLSQIARRQVQGGAFRDFPLDTVAPAESEGILQAVIAVGGARERLGDQKRLLKMVAELAGLAFVHVAQLRAKEEEASRDGLTGLFNKKYLNERLGNELQKARERSTPLSLLIVDIDHFKHYNDTNGHPEGDEVLKAVAKILRGLVREDDVVARYGGEEFVIVFPGATKALAYKQAQAVRRAIEGHPFPHAARQPLGKLTISGGVASCPEDAQSHVELIRAADQALYEAKRAGRNEIRYAEANYLT